MQNFYHLLSVEPSATPEEIKRAFRSEIARYHPDKVQHLGKEFQEMAASRAAALTEAYRTLMNAELRAELGTRPKTHFLMTQLDAAHRTISSLQQQLGLHAQREAPMTWRDAAAESNRLRKAVLGAGLHAQRNAQQQY